MSLSIVLADDHVIVRQGLRALLLAEPDFQLVGEAGDGPEALRQVEAHTPNVLILDLMMPGMNGIEVARQVAKRYPDTALVMLSMHANEAYAAEALEAGVRAYVLKEGSAADLVHGVRAAVAGERYLSPPLTEQSLLAYGKRATAAPMDPYHTLTGREREVLQLTAEGHSGVEIGQRLFISPRTVETHRANLLRKLSLRNQKELVRFAVQRGLTPKGEPGI